MTKYYLLLLSLVLFNPNLCGQCSGNEQVYITTDIAASACQTPEEDVVFLNSSLSNVTATANKLTKISSNNSWNGTAYSYNTVANNGYISFTTNEINKDKALGLSTVALDSISYTTIDFCFLLQNDGRYDIYENGSRRVNNYDSYTTSTVFKIAIESNRVYYYVDNILIYTSPVTPTLPMLTHACLNDTGAELDNIVVSNYNTGNFTANGEQLNSPTYLWYLNGISTGITTSTYSNISLSENNTIYCDITENSGTCNGTIYTSNTITVKTITTNEEIDFYIEGDVATSACNTVEEQVDWVNSSLIYVESSAATMKKVSFNNNWNGGGYSYNSVSNNGYMSFTAGENNQGKAIGLSTVALDSISYTTIDYCFLLQDDGQFDIYENGSRKVNNYGTYTTTTQFRISIESGSVYYYVDDVLIYTSAITPTLPLVVHAAVKDVNAEFNNVVVSNYNTGTFNATTIDAGASPSFQWYLNNNPVGTNSSTYTNTSLSNNDVIYCAITPDVDGCSSVNYNSNTITNKTVSTNQEIDFYIEGDAATSACNTVEEQVDWVNSSLIYVESSAATMKKVSFNNSWNGGGYSYNSVSNNGYMSFTAGENNQGKAIGLSTVALDSISYTTIDYCFLLQDDGQFDIYENGSRKVNNYGTYTTTTQFRISIESGSVYYYVDDVLIYTSAITPTLPLVVHAAVKDVNAEFNNVVVSNYNTGTFNATTIDAGASPSFQWYLNNNPVGTSSSVYTNTSLSNNDAIYCAITPDVDGCSSVNYNSNTITNIQVDNNSQIEFTVSGSVATEACNLVAESISWENSKSVNSNFNYGSISKVSGGNSWNAGGNSINSIFNNGYLEFSSNSSTTETYCGLSSSSSSVNQTSIQYAFYLQSDGQYDVYESGSRKVNNAGNYTTASKFKISVESNIVKYYVDENLIYTSAKTPTLPMIVDVSLKTTGATLNNIVLANYNDNSFVATATNAGTTPSYQWYLNGATVGSNSSSYSAPTLDVNDIVTCDLTPDIAGCTNTKYTSNNNTVITPGEENTWIGLTNDWGTDSNWSNGVPTEYSIVVIPNTGNAPTLNSSFKVYDVEIEAGATLNITGINELSIYRGFTNNGTLNATNGKISFATENCPVANTFDGIGTTQVFDLEVNNTNGVYINSGVLEISNSMTFTTGIVYQNSTLTIQDGASVSGASNNSFVDGPILKIGSTDFIFPTGDQGQFGRIGISDLSGSTTFTAEFIFDAHPTSTVNSDDLLSVSNLVHWNLDHSGSESAHVELYWENAAVKGITNCDVDLLVVAHFDGTEWEYPHETSSVITGDCSGNNNGTAKTRTKYSSFSPFTFGVPIKPLPVEFGEVSVEATSTGNLVQWSTFTEKDNDYFVVQKSNDLNNWEDLSLISGAGNSRNILNYSYVDESTPSFETTYYRIKQVDFNGEYAYSKIVSISSTITTNYIDVYPNPFENELVVNNKINDANIEMFSIDGNRIEITPEKNSDGTTVINTENIEEGMYILKIGSETFKVVK